MFFNKKKNIEKLKIVEDEEKKRKEEEEFDEDDDDEFDMESPILDLDIEPEDIDFSKVFAYHSFVSSQSGQVCVIKDEELVLLDDSNDYWWLVRCCRSNEVGYIPADNVETPIERLARVNRRKNLEILVPDDVPIIKTNYAQKKVTFSKHVKIEKAEAVDDSDDDDCKIHRVNTGSYKGKKKKSIFSKLLGKKDKKSKKDNYYNEAIEPYSNYSDIMEDEEINNPAIMINDTNVIMRIGNVPDEEDEDSDTPPSRLDSLNVLNGSSDLNRPNDFNDGFIEQNGLDKFLEPSESIEPNGHNEINKPNEINKSNERNNLKVIDEPNEYNESYNESNESFDKPIEYDESDEYDKPIEYDNEPNDEYNERNHFSYDKNEMLNPGETVIKVYAGNIELKTQYKNIKIEEDMTARDVLLIAMEKFRIPKSTVDEYYIGVIHFESQEKPVKPDANIMNVIRKLNSKGLPGITVSSRSSLINDTINLLDNRFIKFFLNRKIEEQEKEFKLIRVFIEERDNNNHQIYKTIGVLEHEKVVDVINNALTKFSIYQDKNPYDFTLISLFKHQKVPRDYDDSIYEIIKEVTKFKRRSYDIDFLLKPNKPMNQSNLQNDNSLLQNQLLKNAGNSDKPIKPLPENFRPPARTSSSSAKAVPKRTSSKISEKSDRSGITSPNYQPSSITSPLKEESLLLSFSPPPQLPLYLPFTDARYDSDNSSNPLRFDSNGQDDTIDEDDVSFEDPPRSNSLIPITINSLGRSNEQSNMDKKVENNERNDINRSIDNNVDNNENRSDNILNDDQLRILNMKQRENPPRKSSLDYREENEENPSRINNRQKREDIIGNNSFKGEEGEKEEEEIKTSIDRNNLFNVKSNKQYRASLYSDVDESEMNNLNNNDEFNKNTSKDEPEKLKINIGKKERNEKNEKLNELSDELDDINELVKQLESEKSPISITSINNEITKSKTENLNDTKSPKDTDNGNSSGTQSSKSPLVFAPRVSSVKSPRAIKNKNKFYNSSRSGNGQRPDTRERSKSIDQQRPDTRERSKSIDQQRPDTRERSKSIDQQRPVTRERSKSIDQQRPETHERSKSIDQQRPETHERSKSIDQQRPETHERSKSIDQQHPETRERSRSIDQQRPEVPERSKSIEQQSPQTPERSKSIEQQSPQTPERSKSIEQQSPQTPERSKSIEQQSPQTPERSKSIEQQSPQTPERSESIEQQSPETPERSKSIEQQLPENPNRSESIEQQRPEFPERTKYIEQQRPEFPERTKYIEQQPPEFPERTKSIEQQSPEDPERYKSIEQQRLESPVRSKYEQPQRLESPIRNKSIEQQQLRLESPIRSKSVEQPQHRMESPIRSKSVEQPQQRLENPIRTKSIDQHRLENPVRTKSIDQQRLESPIRSRSVEQHHLENPVRSKSIEQQRLESPIRSKSVDQPRPLRSKSIDQQYSEDPASLEINLSTRSMEDERRNRRHQRPPRDYDRMDDRSVVSSTVGSSSVMTDGSREITISERGVMRDSEGRLLNNDRRRMKPRKPSASPIRDNERRMRQRRHSPGRDGERSMEGENMFMSPDMRERYGRPRGPEDNIPPHMRERRPRGPEDDIPPHIRDRRPRGPEDDIPPHMRDRRPRGAERTPRMGERTPRMGERTPRMGERTPRMGERTPRMGERTPRMGERTPRMGERTPRMNERKAKDPRMSRSCSPNRRRPRAPADTSSPALSSISLRNSPRPPMTGGIELPGKHSSLGRDGGMHKSPLYRNPESVADSPKAYVPERPIRKNSLNKDHCLVSVERKISNNSGKFGNGIDDSLIDTIAKTPLIVNEVEDVKLQSAEVQIMNENGEIVNKNSIKSPDSSHVIDFNELLNSLDTTLQNSNISGHTTGISPTRRKNSDDLERIRNIRKSRFEDMEKSLDSSIQKTRANDSTQMKSNHHESSNIGDNLNNLLKELTSPSPSYGAMNLSGL